MIWACIAAITTPVSPVFCLLFRYFSPIGADGLVNSGDEGLIAVLLAMPGLSNPYIVNAPQHLEEHYKNKPFFVDFPFGYVAEEVNWYEGAGIPFSSFDDFGRENPYPLVRVEATLNSSLVATVDTVLPINPHPATFLQTTPTTM